MKSRWVLVALAASTCWIGSATADYDADAYFKQGERYHKQRQHFQAARYYFQALQRSSDRGQKNALYANISNSLVNQGLYQSASYFFLKAIESQDDRAVRIALNGIRPLFENVGGELFRKYLVKYTREYQYSTEQRDYFFYQIAHDDFLKNRPERVIKAVDAINRSFPSYPSALFLRGTSNLILARVNQGVDDFRLCYEMMSQSRYKAPFKNDEAKEMRNRCAAGVARAYYQGRNYEEADRWYDRVEMDTFVWPQIQYERAWAHVARGDYNRALGRLVTYKSPGLSWFHESEVEMLRAMGFLQMCIYDEVEREGSSFTERFNRTGLRIKDLLERNGDNSPRALVELFTLGMQAMRAKPQHEDPVYQIMNRFVRSPYFVNLVYTGDRVRQELAYMNSLGTGGQRGLGGFLRDVLVWRWQTAQEQGGKFVHDRLATEYNTLQSNVATMDIVKLELLRKARYRTEQAFAANAGEDVWGEKKRGSLSRPEKRDDQYHWDFNGEFWADELGDYVFALRPECGE